MPGQRDAPLSAEPRDGPQLRIISPASTHTRPSEDNERIIPFPHKHPPARSLSEFCHELRDHAGRVADARAKLDALFWQFVYRSPLTPEDCDRATSDLQPLSASIYLLCQLVERAESVPLAVVPLRYPLVVALYYTREQVCQLIVSIGHFRISCQRPSKQAAQQQQEIRRRFEILQRGSDEIVQLVEKLVIQADSHEHIAMAR